MDETIIGTDGPDELFGAAGDDTILGLAGGDFIRGGGGADTIRGGDGSDEIRGGGGDDEIRGGGGRDFLRGGTGDDVIRGGSAGDFLRGGSGDDELSGGSGNDFLDGGSGDDELSGGSGDDFFGGSAGNDTYVGGSGDDFLSYFNSANEGLATEVGLGVVTTIVGGEAVAGRDTFATFDTEAGTVVDIVDTVAGNLNLFEENTVDASVSIAPGPVSVRIVLPDLSFTGSSGEVEVTFVEDAGGFSAGDTFGFEVFNFANAIGTDFDDVLVGSEDANRLVGGGGDDLLRGREGSDTLDGGRGADDLRGGSGEDRLDGRQGADNLKGGAGDDRLFGQQGDDVLRGGAGADLLGGGEGADTFRWTLGDIEDDAGQAVDFVAAFEADDLLLLAGRELTAGEAFDLAEAGASEAGVEFAFNGAGDQIVLRADGSDAGLDVSASEVFARLSIDPGDFLG